MIPEVSILVQLQELDANTFAMQKRLAELPKLLAAERQTIEERKRTLEAKEARKQANEKEQRKLGGESDVRRAKLKKLKAQIEQAANDTQFKAFQHEIDFAEDENRKADDRTLELMEESEALDMEIAAAKTSLAEAQKAGAEHWQAGEKEHKAGQAQLAANAARHKELAGGLPQAASSLYDRLRKKYKTGPVVSLVVDGHCEECQMALRLAFWQQVKGDPEHLYLCEECGRVLHFNAPIDRFEGQ